MPPSASFATCVPDGVSPTGPVMASGIGVIASVAASITASAGALVLTPAARK